MDIEPIKEEQPIETQVPISQDSTATDEDFSYLQLYNFFDIRGQAALNKQTKDAIKNIYDYFKKDSKEYADILWKIKETETKLGVPSFGTTRYDKLNAYISVLKKEESVHKEKETYEKGY